MTHPFGPIILFFLHISFRFSFPPSSLPFSFALFLFYSSLSLVVSVVNTMLWLLELHDSLATFTVTFCCSFHGRYLWHHMLFCYIHLGRLDPQLSNPNNRCYNKLFGQFVFVFLKNHPSNNTLRLFHPYLTTLFISSRVACYLTKCVSISNNLIMEVFVHELISFSTKILDMSQMQSLGLCN